MVLEKNLMEKLNEEIFFLAKIHLNFLYKDDISCMWFDR